MPRKSLLIGRSADRVGPRALAKLSRQLGEASLREAVQARSDYGVLLAALESEPGLAALTPEDPLAEARLRGIDARKRLLEAEGGSLRAQVAASLLNISRQAAYKRYRAGRLIAIDCGRHGLAFPAWQFVPGGVLPGLEQVLAVLADFDPWMKLAFFLEPNGATGGKTPLAALRLGKLRDVLRAAEQHGEHGAIQPGAAAPSLERWTTFAWHLLAAISLTLGLLLGSMATLLRPRGLHLYQARPRKASRRKASTSSMAVRRETFPVAWGGRAPGNASPLLVTPSRQACPRKLAPQQTPQQAESGSLCQKGVDP